jgi:homoserine kinase
LIDPVELHFHSRSQIYCKSVKEETQKQRLPLVLNALHCCRAAASRRASLNCRLFMQQVTIRIPASTSNLGPGFDCLGLALRIYNDLTVTRGTASRPPRIVRQTADLFFRHTRQRPFSFSCSTIERIPRMRGLGSSATIRAGVLSALNELAGNLLDRSSIFHLSAQLEGHPDNAAPATFGGFTVVHRGAGDHLTFQRFEVAAKLYIVLVIPDLEVATSKARRILPARIARLDAVKNCANACAITAAFASRNYENLQEKFADRLHQPFRRKLVPCLPYVVRAAGKAGALGAFLSGSGSGICALTLRDPQKIAAAMQRAAGSVSSSTIITTADNRGARIMRSGNPRSAICNR